MPQELVIATGNPHKVDELRAILGGAGNANLRVLGLGDLPNHAALVEPEETGTTFEANARIKALSYARQTGRVCLADDSGIEIDALRLADPVPHGTTRPGVISSHYCTDGREAGMTRVERDRANNARVLRELEGVEPERRAARFVCCMCVADPGGTLLHETRGTFEGRIGVPPRVPAGENGFGYDPLFLIGPEFERTGAELGSDAKNGVSHRGLAAAGVVAWLDRARTRGAAL